MDTILLAETESDVTPQMLFSFPWTLKL